MLQPTRLAITLLLSLILPTAWAADQTAFGARIAQKGTARGVAYCMTCHGPDGGGMAPTAYPRIAGLDADYLANMVRLNVALAGTLALAPPAPEAAPVLTAVGPDVVDVSWPVAAEPGVAGYFVAWRPVAEQHYRAVLWAGAGPTYQLVGLPAGAVAVAVAAADDLGHMSPFGPEAVR